MLNLMLILPVVHALSDQWASTSQCVQLSFDVLNKFYNEVDTQQACEDWCIQKRNYFGNWNEACCEYQQTKCILILDKSTSELTGESTVFALPINAQAGRPDGKSVGDFRCHGNWAPDFFCDSTKNQACKWGFEWNGDRFAQVTKKKQVSPELSFEIGYGIKQCHQFNATIDRYNQVRCSPRFTETHIISEPCDSYDGGLWQYQCPDYAIYECSVYQEPGEQEYRDLRKKGARMLKTIASGAILFFYF